MNVLALVLAFIVAIVVDSVKASRRRKERAKADAIVRAAMQPLDGIIHYERHKVGDYSVNSYGLGPRMYQYIEEKLGA